MGRILIDALDKDENNEKLYVVFSTTVDDLITWPATIGYLLKSNFYFSEESIEHCNKTGTSSNNYSVKYIRNTINSTRIIEEIGYDEYEIKYEGEDKLRLPEITDEMFIEMCNTKNYFI